MNFTNLMCYNLWLDGKCGTEAMIKPSEKGRCCMLAKWGCLHALYFYVGVWLQSVQRAF
jgi:hypothetical protein